MTAISIKAVKNPAKLFNMAQLEVSYKQLVKRWHPDISGDNDTFLHIQKLYDIAKRMSSVPILETDEALIVPGTGDEYTISYTVPFELGSIFTGPNHITYKFTKDYASLASIPVFRFGSDKMKQEFSKLLPVSYKKLSAPDGATYIIISKNPDQHLLHEVLQSHTLPLEVIVWIFNRLNNLSCYMQVTDQLNFGLDSKSILVCFDHHTVSIVGGWWYTYKDKASLKHMTRATLGLLTSKDKELKRARAGIVGDQIRSVCLAMKPTNPILKNWCQTPSSDSLIEMYTIWDKNVLPKIFPVRKFYKWSI